MKRIQIFKPGQYQSMDGRIADYGENVLRLTAAAYNPAAFKAPIVIGHPKLDAPAMGWVEGLEFSEGVLSAYVDQIDPSFAEQVKSGRYRNVSASFYLPDANTNPKPGILYLKHVGFLGAEAPAVKGLEAASFAEQEGEVLFSAISMNAAFADGNASLMNTNETARELAEARQRLRAFEERERSLVEADNLAFCEKQIMAGRLLPVHRTRVLALLNSAQAENVVSFSENGSTTELPFPDALRSFLAELPKMVEFGEVAGRESLSSYGDAPGFVAPEGFSVDARGIAELRDAQALVDAKGISFSEAVRRVRSLAR